jgi:hypothetical protein
VLYPQYASQLVPAPKLEYEQSEDLLAAATDATFASYKIGI